MFDSSIFLALWLVLALVAATAEVVFMTFALMFVAGAAAVAGLTAWLGVPIGGQLSAFAVSSILGLALVRPLASRRLRPNAPALPSRTERLLGMHGEVTQAIDPVHGVGRVVVMGEDWAARSPEPIPTGTRVVVESADGITLNVITEE